VLTIVKAPPERRAICRLLATILAALAGHHGLKPVAWMAFAVLLTVRANGFR
jgi:hypothetical protein